MNNEFLSRDGALGALLDEYERSLTELKSLYEKFNDDDYHQIVDPNTSDPDCKSIETIAKHVIDAGYHYMEIIFNNINKEFMEIKIIPATKDQAIIDIDGMFKFTENFLMEQYDVNGEKLLDLKVKTSWGEQPLELLLEHAIVHILRHRRQVQKFYNKMITK